MLDFAASWYMHEKLGARGVSIVFEESLLASATGSLSLADAIDGTELVNNLSNKDYLITGATLYADPGYVKLTVYPDGSSLGKRYLVAPSDYIYVPFTPLMLLEVDVLIDYVNSGVANNLFLCLNGVSISESKMPDLTLLTEGLFDFSKIIAYLDAIAYYTGGGDPGTYSGDGGISGYTGFGESHKERCKRGECGI